MENDKVVYLTQEGLNRLQAELEVLRNKRRPEVAERIRQAKEFGDINENAEYDDAKNEQGFVEGRILLLEKLVRNASIIEGNSGSSNLLFTVTLSSTLSCCKSLSSFVTFCSFSVKSRSSLSTWAVSSWLCNVNV